jgi:hypothetical protein
VVESSAQRSIDRGALRNVGSVSTEVNVPHSIFFHGGCVIRGSYKINRLGGPASHGCIRLHPAIESAHRNIARA